MTGLASAPARPATTPGSAAPRQVLLIVCAGVVLASLDLFIVNLALPQIAHDLGASDLGQLSWVLNGYAIVYASLLVFFGRLADRYRRDHGFLLGVVVFTAASAACAASTSVEMLIGFRLAQAAGAALLTPTSLGLVLAAYEPARRQGAVRAWTAAGGMAAGIGPVVGGLLAAASWRWVFLVNVPIGIAALVVGWRRLPRVDGHPAERPDPFGVALVTGGVALLTFGLVKGSDWGWASPSIGGSLAAAGLLLAAFGAHCRHSRTPLISPSLFASRSFTGASIVALSFSASFGAMLLSIVLWEQSRWGWSALEAGLAMAPGPLMVPLVSFGIAGRLIARYGPAMLITAGSVIFGAGVAWWALAIGTEPNYVSGVLGGMILTGLGVGLTLPTMMATASASLPPPEFATGSAVINMIRQTGLALGVAILVAVLGGAAQTGELHAFRTAWWVTAGISLAGVVPALALLRRPAAQRRGRPDPRPLAVDPPSAPAPPLPSAPSNT
ncbi:MFS transporter [Frankia sp. CNm7]|uniref:MFS transporter n=1 Tax=Frankia nepalensis TaxID=1836974 RepID=A0A937RIY2_9ACTN|nr:MFS transporter [Frankia nepalensis]MBL7497630.1 MFS transporter [Frankia nepalensis]MBL7510056.1 MFS transporter [Frankia nepalensis]MBL7517534.1 MFS transporter [Frankia nepalensis]MBL7631077.1 MFS transporter [Frankia nepalensis]